MGKKSNNTVSSTVYSKTSTSNPYATATTDNSGTTASFLPGTAFDSIYNVVNNNIDSLLDEYLNPSLNTVTNSAKLREYTKNLSNQALNSLENTVINPLSNRNMLRSSQATDLYKNLSNQTISSLDSFINNLLAESQVNSAKVLNNLLAAYLSGYNVLSDMQNKSLQTSSGNATKTTSSENSGNSMLSTVIPIMLQTMGSV